MYLLIITFVTLTLIHIGIPFLYYRYMMENMKTRTWDININERYTPNLTILVPTYNEEQIIQTKLRNLINLHYPSEKFEIIVVDSASTDQTLDEVKAFSHQYPQRKIRILSESERRGKSHALNFALPHSWGEVIVTTDSDCLIEKNALRNAVKYIEDSKIGAVCGQEILIPSSEFLSTRVEKIHRQLFTEIRVGESKIHSSIIFEGALAFYKKSILERTYFDKTCDDSGTALNFVQQGYRCILVPDAFFYNFTPLRWREKFTIKTRRAQHLIELWLRCLKLDLTKKLKLPLLISRFEFFLHIINPIIFIIVISILFIIVVNYPFLSVLSLALLLPKIRNFVVLYITDHIFLFIALLNQILGKKQIVWKRPASEEKAQIVNSFYEKALKD